MSTRRQRQQKGIPQEPFTPAPKTQLQRAAVNTASQDAAPPIVQDVLSSPGQALDSETRSFMEPRFGHDFSGVRVHTDERAAESARAVNALAYTAGQDVVFDEGQYKPDTIEGRQLLAHELTHVVQQASISTRDAQTDPARLISDPSDASELAANEAANQATTERSGKIGSFGQNANQAFIQRQAPPVPVPIVGAAATVANFVVNLRPAGSGGLQLTNVQFTYARDRPGPSAQVETRQVVLELDAIKSLGSSFAFFELVLKYDGQNIISAYTQQESVDGYEGGALGSEAGVNFSAVRTSEPTDPVAQVYLLFEGFNNPSGFGFQRFNGRLLVTGSGEVTPQECRLTSGDGQATTSPGWCFVGWRPPAVNNTAAPAPVPAPPPTPTP